MLFNKKEKKDTSAPPMVEKPKGPNRAESRARLKERHRNFYTKKYHSSKAKHNAFEILPDNIKARLIEQAQAGKKARAA
jgi:hypothetical protein